MNLPRAASPPLGPQRQSETLNSRGLSKTGEGVDTHMMRRNFLKLCASAPIMAFSSLCCSAPLKGLKCAAAFPQSAGKTRIEPIFQKRTPLLFAHRGGVAEAPESTIRGFRHAINSGSDVLELDVQLTRDGEIVVWHGPDLNNVRIENVQDDPKERTRKNIYDYAWCELDRKAWVADPIGSTDLSKVDQDGELCLLRLSDFLDEFPTQAANIELKESFLMQFDAIGRSNLQDNIKAFCDILAVHGRSRKIVVVSARFSIIEEFRRQDNNLHSTGLSPFEQLLFYLSDDREAVAFETSHVAVTEYLVRRVRKLCGSLFVFVTEFGPIHALDNEETFSDETRKKIFALLDMGVDGIMTDRPSEMRKVMDSWLTLNGS